LWLRETALSLLRFRSPSTLSKRVKTSSEVSLAVACSNDFFVWSNMSDLSLGYEFLKALQLEKGRPVSQQEVTKSWFEFHIVARLLKARIMKPTERAAARERLCINHTRC
jgi:hypothetical protein